MRNKKIVTTTFNMFKRNIFFFANKNNNLYEILGVNKNSTATQIKKAYYKLAQQHHPDKSNASGAKEKFTEINNAYEVLSDQEKRRNYDQMGTTDDNGFGFSQQDAFKNYYSNNSYNFNGKGRNSQHNQDFQSMFQDLFGGGFQEKTRKRNNQPPKQDLLIKLQIDFKQSVLGTKKNIRYNRVVTCSTCKGSKSSLGSKPQKCGVCQGTGFMTMRQGIMMIRMQCNGCNGQGVKITSPCKPCSGVGSISAQNQQQIIIPRGIHDGASLKFKGKGNMNGDLTIKINVKRHPVFKRQGIDCLVDKQISIIDAVLGTQIQINNLNDELKKVKILNGTQNGQKIKLVRQGFYKLNSTQKGSMIITVNIKMPKNISKQQKQLYQKLRQVRSQSK